MATFRILVHPFAFSFRCMGQSLRMTRFLRLSRKMRSSDAAAAEEDDHPSPTEEWEGTRGPLLILDL